MKRYILFLATLMFFISIASSQIEIDRNKLGVDSEAMIRADNLYGELQSPIFLEGELDCSDFVFPLNTRRNNFSLENKKDCGILQEEEYAEEYLEELVNREQKCWEYAQDSYETLEEDVAELIEDIGEIDEYVVEEAEREKSPIEEYADMLVAIVTATIKIAGSIDGENVEEAFEEMQGVSYRNDYEYNIRDRFKKIEKKAEKSCNKAKGIRESLGQICRFVNNQAFLQGGLSEEQKAATISQIRRELEKKEERLSEAEEKHAKMAENGANIDAWFYDKLSGINVLEDIRKDCKEAEIVEMMGRLFASRYGNKTRGEILRDFFASQKNMEGKELTGILGRLFGNEKINLIIRDNGNETSFNLDIKNKKIVGFDAGKIKKPGMRVYMSGQDIDGIINGQDMNVLASGVREGRIRYEGVGFAKKIKVGVVGFFARLAGFN